MSAAVRAGYKQTDAGVIPQDWRCQPLNDLTDPMRPIGYGIVQTGKNVRNGVKCVRVVDMIEGHIDPDLLITTSEEISSAYKRTLLREDDVVIALRGKIGAVAVIQPNLAGSNLTRGVALLSNSGNFDSSYLSQYLSSATGKSVIERNLNGSALQEMPIAALRKLPAVVPPLPEQRAIATALSDVDALLAKLDALIAKKRDLKVATMQQLLTGQTRLPGFSGEWEVKRLGDVADIDPESLGSNTAPNYEFNYISLEDVDVGVLRSFSHQVLGTAPSRARRKIKSGDVLVSTVRPNLQSHLHFSNEAPHWVCSTGFSVVRGRAGITNSAYVFAHLFGAKVSRQIDTLLTGSNYPAINSRDVRALEIPIPPYEEQTAIATVLSDMDTELTALEARRDKTRALKQGMMQELLTGRIRLI